MAVDYVEMVPRPNLTSPSRGLLSQAAAAASSVSDAVVGSVTSGSAGGTFSTSSNITPPPRQVMENKDHCKILLVIDDRHNDWSVTYSFISS